MMAFVLNVVNVPNKRGNAGMDITPFLTKADVDQKQQTHQQPRMIRHTEQDLKAL